MKTLFVDTFEYLKAMNKYPAAPAGLLNLTAIMQENGHEAEIINFNYLFLNRMLPYAADSRDKFRVMAEYLIAKKPDIIGFTSVCSLFHNALYLAKVIKELDKTIIILFGGPHVSGFPANILERYSWVDAVCVGEAETTIAAIAEGMIAGELSGVAGVVYRHGGKVVENPPPPLIEDLDNLPLIDYTQIPSFADIREIPLETGRGCPYRCIYCSTSGFWQRKFRVKSIERICREIDSCQRALGGKKVFYNFVHDNFTTNYEFTAKLCQRLKEFGIDWGCGARVDTLDEPLISLMAEAGCRSVLIGLETASPAMQSYIRKDLDLEKFLHLVDVLTEHKITVIVSFIYGFPPETEEDLKATLRMVSCLLAKGVYSHLHSLGVLYGTPLYDMYQDKLILGEYYSDLADTANLAVCMDWIRADKEIFSQFYSLPDTLASRYSMLDKFVNLIYIKLYALFPATLAALLRSFDDDLLAFYHDFIRADTGFADFIESGEYNAAAVEDGFVSERSPLGRKLIGFLTEYINEKSFCDFAYKLICQRFCAEKETAASRF